MTDSTPSHHPHRKIDAALSFSAALHIIPHHMIFEGREPNSQPSLTYVCMSVCGGKIPTLLFIHSFNHSHLSVDLSVGLSVGLPPLGRRRHRNTKKGGGEIIRPSSIIHPPIHRVMHARSRSAAAAAAVIRAALALVKHATISGGCYPCCCCYDHARTHHNHQRRLPLPHACPIIIGGCRRCSCPCGTRAARPAGGRGARGGPRLWGEVMC